MIELSNINKIYGHKETYFKALDNINLSIKKGEYISIIGPSGSGKSTLLNIIGCLDSQTNGDYILNGNSIKNLSNDYLSNIRNQYIGFIFQNFMLLNNYTVYENIELPLNCRNISSKKKKELILNIAKKLYLSDLLKRKPYQISGGQQQKVAIARALIIESNIILADEPTGALDQKAGEEILTLLTKINKEGKTVIIVTHNNNVSTFTKRQISIYDGKITNDCIKTNLY